MERAIMFTNETCKRASGVIDIKNADVMDVESDNIDKLQTKRRKGALSAAIEFKRTKDSQRESKR